MRNDSTNYCRSDYTLGVAARMLLLDVCEPGSGYGDHDIPSAVWLELGTQIDAFLAVNADDLGAIDDSFDADQVATHWIGSRNGAGIGFWSLACETGITDDEREALTRLDASANSQGEVSMYAGDDAELYLDSTTPAAWVDAYEKVREANDHA